ncbi:MAG TPA: hypothetical protein VME66_13305 [Candidatus Acidoferrales bacterium]|nr:hypothetical protein [Candidatus Acidoferrales bacterium]
MPAAGSQAWMPWPVNWSAVWVGALASLAAALILGLIGTALGAQSIKTLSSWQDVSRVDVAITVCAAFFAFAIGGWVSGKISGARHAEPSILHAAVAWLVALPLLLLTLAAGGGAALGGWYGGLLSAPAAAAASAAASPDVARNDALAAVTAILIALIGAVIGGWIASGEPMSFTHHRTRATVWHAERKTL